MMTCKLLCVLYVAVASVLVLGGGSNGSVRALPDVSVLYIRAATTVSGLFVFWLLRETHLFTINKYYYQTLLCVTKIATTFGN